MCSKFTEGYEEGQWPPGISPCKGCFTYKGFPKIEVTENNNPWELKLYTNNLPSSTGGGGVHAIVHWVDEEPWGGNNVNGAETNAVWDNETSVPIVIFDGDNRYADDCGVCRHPQCIDGDESLLNLAYNPCGEGEVPGHYKWNQEC
jgi:hypothetical protein